MVLEIVQKSHFIVPSDSIDDDKEFESRRKQIPVFNGYFYHFYCQEKNENILIYLFMNCETPVTVSCTFTVNSITQNFVHTFKQLEGHGFSQFGTKSELFVNGVMTVDVKLKIKFISENVEVVDEPPHTVALLDDEKFKDFTINAEDTEIKVHKCVLTMASPVFAAMFESHTKEFKEGRVEIEDFDFETIKAGVKLMYTRKNPDELSLNSLLNLYKFADKYDLFDMEKVLEILTEKLCLETIPEITKFSKVNSMDELYEKCVDFYAKDFEENSRIMDNFEQLDPQFLKDAIRMRYQPL
uniref:BTB domain-containing protein n=1 Tax=Panagrolaimus sp. JU765 TaxID=591449 RepID=A0AC34PY62_9BILA